MTANDKVRTWIEENFDLEQVKVEPFNLLPGGYRVIDKNGDELLAWYDILADAIRHDFPNVKGQGRTRANGGKERL